MRHQKFQSAPRGGWRSRPAEFKPIKIRPPDESSRVIIFQMRASAFSRRVKRGRIFLRQAKREFVTTSRKDGGRKRKEKKKIQKLLSTLPGCRLRVATSEKSQLCHINAKTVKELRSRLGAIMK